MVALSALQDWLKEAKPYSSIACTGLWGSSKAFYLEQLRQKLNRSVFVLCPTENEARTLVNDLRFFQGQEIEDDELEVKEQDALEVVEARQSLGETILLPGWGVRFHEQASPPKDVVQARIGLYSRMLEPKPCIIVATVDAVLHKGMSRSLFEAQKMHLEIDQDVEPAVFVGKLVSMGYRLVDLVESPGQFSKRGGILDFFSPQYSFPLRIEFLGDQIESLRFFDPSTQRSRASLLEADVLPVSEIVFEPTTLSKAKQSILAMANSMGTSEEDLVRLLDDLDRGVHFPQVEWYMPHFYKPVSLFEWLEDAGILVLDGASSVRSHLEELVKEQAWELETNNQRNKMPVDLKALLLEPESLLDSVHQPKIELEVLRVERPGPRIEFTPKTLPPVRGRWDDFFAELKRLLADGWRVHIVGPQPADLEHIKQMLIAHEIQGEGLNVPVHYVRGHLTLGFLEPETKQVFFTIAEIYGKARRHHRLAKRQTHEFISSFRDLKPGDLVVHMDHGIGQYVGLRRLDIQGVRGDFLELHYDGADKLFVPMSMLHLIQRYRAVQDEEGQSAYLDRLGTAAWGKVKERVKKAIRQMAGELLQLYAARKMVEGVVFSADGPLQHEFEAKFEFDPTPDQQRTFDEVKTDMESPQPMDRLVCGDVGFGKTEVAMRAAHKATVDGYQVAVLVPTTILAQQHFNSFTKRFRGFNTRIEMLSRFVTAKQTKEVLQGVKAGAVQIVIGTHALLSRTIEFARLGLLIVDEEHRFGVAHKERIKQIKKKVDVLTLTATPIPRTLHMSMLQIRDLSIINTAPVDRLPVITRLATFEDDIVREAVQKELKRGGQVFFIHNRVQTIDGVAERLRKILPKTRIAVAHGQMDEKLLEQTMVDFVNRRYHVLVCTVIIESGMDIPSANTIIINRADHFGLAQLYQLRGRVGRGRQRAYCYLLAPPVHMLTSDAQERLRVIQELTELGSGFRLAAHDMEIRGAGNLLGDAQSGHIEAIGFDTYSRLMEQTIQELRGEVIEDRPEPTIKLDMDAYLPDDYVPDINQRLILYRNLSGAKSVEDIDEVADGLEDRYGRLPLQAEILLEQARIKILAIQLRVDKVDLMRGLGSIVFSQDASLDLRRIKMQVDRFQGRLSYKPPIIMRLQNAKPAELVQVLRGLVL